MPDVLVTLSSAHADVVDRTRGAASRAVFLSGEVASVLVPAYQTRLDAAAAAVVTTALHSQDAEIQAAYEALVALIEAPPAFVDGLECFFNFLELAGARHSVVNGYVLSDINGPIGRVDDAARIVAAQQQDFSAPDAVGLRTGQRDWTIGLRLRVFADPAGYNTPAIIGRWDPGAAQQEYELFLRYDVGELVLVTHITGDDKQYLVAPLPPLGEFFTVVFGYDTAADQVWMRVNNGTPVTLAGNGGPYAGTGLLHVGSTRGGSAFINADYYALAMHGRLWSEVDHDWFHNGGLGRKLVL